MIEYNSLFKTIIALIVWGMGSSSLLAKDLPQVKMSVNLFRSFEQRFPSSRIGIQIIRCSDTTEIFSYRSGETFIPASIVKILSTGAALRTRGIDYRFVTQLYSPKSYSRDTLHHQLYLRTSGDPSISSKYLSTAHQPLEQVIAHALFEQGVRYITDNILIDASLPIEQGAISSWMEEDLSWAYGAGLYGFNYQDNALDLYVNSIGRLNQKPTLEDGEDMQQLRWVNKLRIGRQERVRSQHRAGSSQIELTGTVPRGRERYRLKLYNPNPAALFSARLRQALDSLGITWRGKAIAQYSPLKIDLTTHEILCTYRSPRLDSLALITNHHSHNLFAEGLAELLSQPHSRGTSLSNYWLNRLGISHSSPEVKQAVTISLVDGSGLSRANRLSPEGMNLALIDLMGGYTPHDGALVGSLPQIGLDGTVKNLMPEGDLTAYLKSGSMRGVLCYAGYIYHENEWYVITYMSNNVPSISSSRAMLVEFLRQGFGTEYSEAVTED